MLALAPLATKLAAVLTTVLGGGAGLAGPAPVEAPASTAPAPAPTDWFVTEVAFGTSVGVGFFDTRKPSAPLEREGYPGYTATHWTPFAVNGELWIDRHVPAFDFIRYTQARADRAQGGVKSQLQVTVTQLSYGYAVARRAGFAVVPRAGLGFAEVQQRLHLAGELDYEEVLDSLDLAQAPTFELQKTAAVFDLGLSLTYLWTFGRKPLRPGMGTGVRVGLRFGGLVQLFDFGPQGEAWSSAGARVRGAPDMRLDGAYLRLFVAPSLLHRSRR